MQLKPRFSFSIRLTLFSIFMIATTITAGVAILLQYHFSTEQASRSAHSQFQMSAKYTRDHLAAIDHQATDLTSLLAVNTSHSESPTDFEQIHVFAKAMENNPIYYSIFIGTDEGHFLQLINLDASNQIRKRFNAAHMDRWLAVQVIRAGSSKKRILSYLDETLNVRIRTEHTHDFDPRVRPWFTGAAVSHVYKSAPYQFQSLQAPGLTYSQKLSDESSVVGVDIALTSLSNYLHEHQLVQNSEIYLYQNSGEVIASNSDKSVISNTFLPDVRPIPLSKQEADLVRNTPTLQISNSADWSPIDFSIAGQPRGYAIDKLNLVSKLTGIEFEYNNGFSWPQLVERYKHKQLDALQAVYNTDENTAMGVLSAPFLNLPFALVTKKQEPTLGHISQLNHRTLAITKGWSITEQIKKHFPEIKIIEVETIRDVFDYVRQGKADAGIDTQLTLLNTQSQFFMDDTQIHNSLSFTPYVFPETVHLLLQPKYQALIPIINRALASITNEQATMLKQRWLNLNVTETPNTSFVVPNKTLLAAIKNSELQDKLIPHNESELVFISPVKINDRQQSYFAIIAKTEYVFATSKQEVKISILLTSICLLCLLPLSYFFAAPIVKPIHKLMVENKKIKQRRYDEVKIEPSHIKEIDQLGLSLSEMSQAIQIHEKQQADLLESIIQLIAQAIDDKSPYTAGHCKRVPDIGMRLALAASESNHPYFADFKLNTPEQLREFKMAAWLHDCGKITTPEHIVDKSTKLETIYNRIHEIRMRFEVLWRDALIDYHQQVHLNPESSQFFKTELKRKQAQLHDDFAFIARCNLGGEFLGDEQQARLISLSKVTWERYFDDTLGLSDLELERKPLSQTSMPVVEQLLRDKPEHQHIRVNSVDYADKFGIKMDIPTLQANTGELYNLLVSRGTLTTEDRFRINEHMISTIKMLDSLPFPKELSNVPRWASTHHETLNGKGYPRKLTQNELSIPELILVVADIFEALTASDRPYKKAKTLSESLKIMHIMVKEEHIHQEVFELFLTSGVYLEYAKQHLASAQIDNVDINEFIAPAKVA